METNLQAQLKSIGLVTAGHVALGETTTFEKPVAITAAKLIGSNTIGAFTYINASCELWQTSIGRYCSIAEYVAVGPNEHPIDWFSTCPFTYNWNQRPGPFHEYEEYQRIVNKQAGPEINQQTTTIGSDVWLGHGSFIKKGITIGHGAVVAARAVVTSDVPPYHIVGGIPAKTIRKRFDDKTINQLLELQWWNYDLAPMQNKVDYANVQQVIDQLYQLKNDNKLQPFTPKQYTLTNTGRGLDIKAK